MSAGKIIGGILAFIGALFILIMVFIHVNSFAHGGSDIIRGILNLIVVVLAIVGSMMGIKSKKNSGMLCIIAGLISFILGSIFWFTLNDIFWQYSLFSELLHVGIPKINLFLGISIEAILIVFGGIIGLGDDSN